MFVFKAGTSQNNIFLARGGKLNITYARCYTPFCEAKKQKLKF